MKSVRAKGELSIYEMKLFFKFLEQKIEEARGKIPLEACLRLALSEGQKASVYLTALSSFLS